MNGQWYEVKVITNSESIEPISGIFYGLDVKGVSIEDPNDIIQREQGPLTWDFADINILEYKGKYAVVRGYFNITENGDELLTYVKNKIAELRESGMDVGLGEASCQVVKEEDWANNWKKYYVPTKIGESIVVKPIWENYSAKEGELVVELDPGMAFGTGTHETTRMCVKALERTVKHENVVFDIGTGSGILAITAAKLGAKHVIGVDLDPVAVDSALENVKFNKLNNIEILKGDLMEVVQGKADIIVANIIAEVIVILTDQVKKFLDAGGLFITSGIIRDREKMVVDKLEKEGFEVVNIERDGEWVCITSKLK
ncbi:50S ribosomal protein L11 methyltransferase [Clostridium oryzae]|nr:50S ribosomal protein L11 methyltransferase [Clostridium oryzae]